MAARGHVIVITILASFLQSTGVFAEIQQCQKQYNCTSTSCPHWPSDVNTTVLVHTVVTRNTTSTMHYLWGVAGYPTFMLSEANTPITGYCDESLDFLNVDLPEYAENQTEGSVNLTHFSFDSNYSFALVLRSLVEFNVKESESNESFCADCFGEDFWSSESYNCSENKRDSSQKYCIRPLSGIEWGSLNNGQMEGVLKDVYSNATEHFVVKFDPKAENGHETFFPMPFYTSTSAVLDIILSNIIYNISGKHNRLALELLLVHGPSVSGGGISQRYSFDDEYTPSVFYSTIYDIERNGSSSPGYVTWKGISYMDGSRISSNSQQMSYNPDPTGKAPLQNFQLPGSLARAVFGDRPVEVKRMFLVFGTSGADLSLNSQYVTCTAVLGVGQPPKERLSAVVIIVIIVGFGVPGAVVLLGIVFLMLQKIVWRPLRKLYRKRKSDYAPL